MVPWSPQVPGLVHLLHPGEGGQTLWRLPPEELLIRWVNYHLEKVAITSMLVQHHPGWIQ